MPRIATAVLLTVALSTVALSTVALPGPGLPQGEAVPETADEAAVPAEAPEPTPLSPMEKIELLASDERSSGERFREFVDLLYRYTLDNFPEIAPTFGESAGQDRWSDLSFAAIQRRKSEAARSLEVLETLERTELSPGAQLDYDLLRRRFELDVRGHRFPAELLPISQVDGIQLWVADTLSNMPRRTVADCEDVLARLDAVPGIVDDVISLLQRGLARGVTPPRVTLRDVPQQFSDLATEDPLESPLLRAFRDLPRSIPEGEKERLRAAARASYTTRVKPALEKIHRFLTLSYLGNARDTIALGDLPRGAAWYAYLAETYTTTSLSPQEIHDLGLGEVERIRAEMEKVIAELGFQDGFEAFHEFLRTYSGFFYNDPEEMLRDYRDIAKRADAALLDLFGHLPRMPYGVEPIPAHVAPSQTAAYYSPGSLEAGRTATFFVNTNDLKSRPKWRMESLTLHEAVPGHHLQVSIAQESEELPWFRRIWGPSAMIEGWALYTESLGYEMGFYKDPYQRYGQLTSEMWRALRLVVDTGLHVLGWSRQQAIDYMYAHTGRPEHEIVVEVDRYLVWPGQALAYKVGELRIREIRARAEAELGDRFDLRAFHDALLEGGALPLDVLERRMDEWIAARKVSP